MPIQHAVNFAAYNTDRYPQPNIWNNFPSRKHNRFRGYYVEWWDDFHFIPVLTTASGAINRYPYMSYIDTGNTITTLATEQNRGVLRLATDASDNDAPVITSQGNDGNHVMFDDNTAGDKMDLWFDSRWRKSSIADNECAMFMGFTEEARAVDNGIMADDDATLASIDAIGFRVLQDNGEELDFAFRKAGQTAVEVGAALVTTTNSAATGLAASTWYKTGFKYSNSHPTANRIKLSINNKEDANYVTGTQMAAATFPDGEELVFATGSKNGAATAVNFDIDWIWFAQEIVPD